MEWVASFNISEWSGVLSERANCDWTWAQLHSTRAGQVRFSTQSTQRPLRSQARWEQAFEDFGIEQKNYLAKCFRKMVVRSKYGVEKYGMLKCKWIRKCAFNSRGTKDLICQSNKSTQIQFDNYNFFYWKLKINLRNYTYIRNTFLLSFIYFIQSNLLSTCFKKTISFSVEMSVHLNLDGIFSRRANS